VKGPIINTVEPLITHTRRWTAQGMGYKGSWVLRGNFWCKQRFGRPGNYGLWEVMGYKKYGLRGNFQLSLRYRWQSCFFFLPRLPDTVFRRKKKDRLTWITLEVVCVSFSSVVLTPSSVTVSSAIGSLRVRKIALTLVFLGLHVYRTSAFGGRRFLAHMLPKCFTSK
jgi:hypothetical protein